MTLARPETVAKPGPAAERLELRPKTKGLIPKGLTLLAVLIIILMLTVIMGNIFINGIGTISWDFLTSPPEQGMESGGVFPAIFGTVLLVILMVIAVVPVGVFTAIYLQEYTRPDSPANPPCGRGSRRSRSPSARCSARRGRCRSPGRPWC